MQKLILCSLILLIGFTQARAAEDEAPPPATSAYVSLGDPMVLNLSDSRKLTFLQISADVLISDADAEATIKTHVPAIRHSLIMLLSEQKAVDIKSPARREEIRQQATARIKGLIAELSGSQDVSDVLFSSILVQ
ncbi:MAG: flagellar basal body-associated FliL family protein [Gammaproteobacteria bacterium]|nr:flagellar basal body-associated FliL family protein [Gammaproteobacteria bacterium]